MNATTYNNYCELLRRPKPFVIANHAQSQVRQISCVPSKAASRQLRGGSPHSGGADEVQFRASLVLSTGKRSSIVGGSTCFFNIRCSSIPRQQSRLTPRCFSPTSLGGFVFEMSEVASIPRSLLRFHSRCFIVSSTVAALSFRPSPSKGKSMPFVF
jgi:hypothetical protein